MRNTSPPSARRYSCHHAPASRVAERIVFAWAWLAGSMVSHSHRKPRARGARTYGFYVREPRWRPILGSVAGRSDRTLRKRNAVTASIRSLALWRPLHCAPRAAASPLRASSTARLHAPFASVNARVTVYATHKFVAAESGRAVARQSRTRHGGDDAGIVTRLELLAARPARIRAHLERSAGSVHGKRRSAAERERRKHRKHSL